MIFQLYYCLDERCTGDLVYGCTNCELKCHELHVAQLHNYTYSPICDRMCYRGCHCPEDLYRYGSDDKCYKEQDCPAAHIGNLHKVTLIHT